MKRKWQTVDEICARQQQREQKDNDLVGAEAATDFARQLAAARTRYESGDLSALADAIRLCSDYQLPMPDWPDWLFYYTMKMLEDAARERAKHRDRRLSKAQMRKLLRRGKL